MRSPGQGATGSAGDASVRVRDRNETCRLQMPPQCRRRHTDGRRRAAHTSLGSLLGRLVLNGTNTDGLLVWECRALTVDLGVCVFKGLRDPQRLQENLSNTWRQKVQERSWGDGSGALSLGL